MAVEMKTTGALAWMTRNSVAANLLMLMLMVGGLAIGRTVTQEVFPELDLDIVSIGVPYPGASPEAVESGVLQALEEAVQGVEGVKKVTSTASEAYGSATVSLVIGTDPDKALADIKNSVDRISSFPGEAERPIVSLITSRAEVQSLVIYGERSEMALRNLAEELRETLLTDPKISQVDLAGLRALEIGIDISQSELRRYGLTLEQVAGRVRDASAELPGGSVKTKNGEILVRTGQRHSLGSEYGKIRLINGVDGSSVFLKDIATIQDAFQESDEAAYFNGKPAVTVKVFRVGDQTPIEVSLAVQAKVEEFRKTLSEGVEVAVWQDSAAMYEERLDLLLRNAAMGLLLVFIVLGLFLEIRLAFWVTLGIPISFLGSLLFLPAVDVSINMISLFSYLLTLGIVVDDAVVVGENVFQHRERGLSPIQAAIAGVQEIAVPVTFSVLTTVAAFLPMFFIPGVSGKFFRVIPATVIIVLFISLVESLFVLPAHLGHLKSGSESKILEILNLGQRVFGRALTWFIQRPYRAVLDFALNNKAITMAAGVGMLILCGGFVAGGRIGFVYMPKIESDIVTATIRLPVGVNVEETKLVQGKVVKIAQELISENGGESLCRGVFTQIGGQVAEQNNALKKSSQGGNEAKVQILLRPSGERSMSAFQFSEIWRDRVGEIPGVEKLSFNGSTGPSTGAPIDIQLQHKDQSILQDCAKEVAAIIGRYPGTHEIDNGVSAGKSQLELQAKAAALSLGLNSTQIGQQVRGAFFGIEARRLQRARDEVRVMVRYPKDERCSEGDIEDLVLLTPQGGEVSFNDAVTIRRGKSFSQIVRIDGRRAINVTAELDATVSAQQIKSSLVSGPLKALAEKTPGLSYSLEGENREQAETAESLGIGSLLALLLIYGLLAIPFKSYIQPIIIMAAIPFGFIGVVIGHLLTGYDLSIVSMLGVVALAGVVVNDSLVLIASSNSLRAEGMSVHDAVREAGLRRFRPIMLTSLTTFFGLIPMILETSLQARFLIPMAVALGFGVLFATFVILLLVPVLTLFVEDAKCSVSIFLRRLGVIQSPKHVESMLVGGQPAHD